MVTIPIASLGAPSALTAEPPARKMLAMVVLLAVKDRATEVEFEPSPADQTWQMRYKVLGAWYELVPAPLFVAVVAEVRRWFGLKRANPLLRFLDVAGRPSRVAKAHRVRFEFADQAVELQITFRPAKLPTAGRAEGVAIQLAADEPASLAAQRFLRELYQALERAKAKQAGSEPALE